MSTPEGNDQVIEFPCKGAIVGDRYRLGDPLMAGAYGDVFEAICTFTNEKVAVKLEKLGCTGPQLEVERRVYKSLHGAIGIPKMLWYGQGADNDVMVIELLGQSLRELFALCQNKFSLKTVLMLGDQLLRRLEYLHSKNYIHRDIKPENVLMGRGAQCKTVYMIDFGFAMKFRDPRTSSHIPWSGGKRFMGTYRYASKNAHLGVQQSRRDDLEALGYVLIYFLRGKLPWQGLRSSSEETWAQKVCRVKLASRVEDLCEGLPEEFSEYLKYAQGLRFEEVPDYSYLRRLFRKLAKNLNYNYDSQFDWMTSETLKE